MTTAGLVFGFTMFAMIVAPARNIAQLGTAVGLGLLMDTLIVRSFVVPAIATLLGRWFWWRRWCMTGPRAGTPSPAL